MGKATFTIVISLLITPYKSEPRNISEAITCLKFASEVLVNASEEEKKEYIRKTGQEPSVVFLSDGMMEAFQQVHSMFPKKSTSHESKTKPRNISEAITCLKFASEILVNASEKEKQEYIKKTGQEPSILFISDGVMEALKQVHSMFPKKYTSRESKTKGSKPEDEEIDRLSISQPRYCELTKVAKHESGDYTSIESGKDAT